MAAVGVTPRVLAVTVNPNTDNMITSSSGTDNQTICGTSTSITNITYSTTGATGITFSGLPGGVTVTWVSNTVTISGTPTETGTFLYTVSSTGGCSTATANGTIIINQSPTVFSGCPALTNWSYNQSITIDNTANSNALINFQVMLTVNTESLISEGHMRTIVET